MVVMDRFQRNFFIVVVAYVLIAIFTFGHAAAHSPKCVETDRHICAGNDQALAGMVAAFAWPFYWSWEAWS